MKRGVYRAGFRYNIPLMCVEAENALQEIESCPVDIRESSGLGGASLGFSLRFYFNRIIGMFWYIRFPSSVPNLGEI